MNLDTPRTYRSHRDIFTVLDAESADHPLIRCAVYTRQSVVHAGDDPALTSCAVQRTLCTEFISSMAWRGGYAIGEHFDDEGCSGSNVAVLDSRRRWES